MATLCLEARIGNRITDREMVHHLSLLGRDVEIIVHLVIVKRADASRPESERLRGEIVVLGNWISAGLGDKCDRKCCKATNSVLF